MDEIEGGSMDEIEGGRTEFSTYQAQDHGEGKIGTRYQKALGSRSHVSDEGRGDSNRDT